MLNSLCLNDYIITSPELENITMDNLISWTPADMLEITLNEPDDFLKVRETLTRIGVASRKEQKLFQSCHILHNNWSNQPLAYSAPSIPIRLAQITGFIRIGSVNATSISVFVL